MSLYLTFQGRAGYNSAPGTELSTRPILEVAVGGQSTTAYLDTGMPCVVCPPDFAAKVLKLDPAKGSEEEARIRGVVVKGRIHNASVHFIADEGMPVVLANAVVFVPNSAADVGPDLTMHSFLGMARCLNEIIFGVDPLMETFYFK